MRKELPERTICSCLSSLLALAVLSASSFGETSRSFQAIPQECRPALERVSQCVEEGGRCWEEVSLLVVCLDRDTGVLAVQGWRKGNSLALDLSRSEEPSTTRLAFPITLKDYDRFAKGEESFFRIGKCIRADAADQDNSNAIPWAVVLLDEDARPHSRYYGFPDTSCKELKPVAEANHPKYFSSKVASYIDLGPVPSPRAPSQTNRPKERKSNYES